MRHSQAMKIAIVIPVYDSAKAGFLKSLCRMVIYTLNSDIKVDGVSTRPALEVFTKSTSILPLSRNLLFMDAPKWGAVYVLMLDADHVFPPDALIRLLRHQVLCVGANYVRRADASQASASADGERIMSTKEKAAEPRPQEVDHVGLGFCLVSAAVFKKLTAQAAKEGEPTFSLSSGLKAPIKAGRSTARTFTSAVSSALRAYRSMSTTRFLAKLDTLPNAFLALRTRG